MKNYNKQNGASMPIVIIFISMTVVILTIAFKLYPAFYENWQLNKVVQGFDQEDNLSELSVAEIKSHFEKRLLTNNVRDFDINEDLTILKQDGTFSIYIEYEVRVPIYDNIDAIVSFQESLEKQL